MLKQIKYSASNTWAKLSFLFKSAVTYPYNFRLGYYVVSVAGVDLQYYFDNVMLIDLTETFGSGNEPNKEWCDSHIRYFDGTTTIYK